MSEQPEETLTEVSKKIDDLTKDVIIDSTTTISKGEVFYKVQHGHYDGQAGYFNPKGEDSRYGLTCRKKGSLYLANTPKTCLGEVFKGEFIKASDLEKSYIAELKTKQNLELVDVTKLAPKMGVTIHDITGPNYLMTQKLAAKLSSSADGFTYLSNVTGEKCSVLWSTEANGPGVIETIEITKLSDFNHNGVETEDILTDELNKNVI